MELNKILECLAESFEKLRFRIWLLEDRRFSYIEDVKNILLKNDNVDKSHIIKWLKELSLDSENNYFKSFNDLLT